MSRRNNNIYLEPQKKNPNYTGFVIFLIIASFSIYCLSNINMAYALQKPYNTIINTEKHDASQLSQSHILVEHIEPKVYTSIGVETSTQIDTVNTFTQYENIDTFTSLEEIEQQYQNILHDLDNTKDTTITQLKEVYEKKLDFEGEYFSEMQKQIDKHYETLKEKYLLTVEKKELEEKLKSVIENLYNKNNKIYESTKRQQHILENKIVVDKVLINKENQIMEEQHNKIKKMF